MQGALIGIIAFVIGLVVGGAAVWVITARSHQQMRDTFQSLAGQALQTNTDEFLKRSKEQLEGILTGVKGDWNTQKAEIQNMVQPMGKNLDKLDEQIRLLEAKREGAYQGLGQQINEMVKSNRMLQETTTTLVSTLKSPTARGRWGEMQLRRVVEMAGMVKQVDFEEQAVTDSGRPDMIVHLPNGGILPVDAKTPMDAYLEAVSATSESERQQKLTAHAAAMRKRIQELAQRGYWSQFERTPEIVVMFIPNEACLSAAFETDSNILDAALEKRVLPASPITLLALLQAVAYGWQQQQLTDNARTIRDQGIELYKRFVVFLDHFQKLGKSLGGAVDLYNKAVGSIESRIIPAANKLRAQGAIKDDLISPEPIEQPIRSLEAQPAVEEDREL